MDNQKPSRELIGLLKEYFVEELKQILIAYEKGDVEGVNRIVSEIDRYSYSALMMYKNSSNNEKAPFIEKNSRWEKYRTRFLSEGYKGNSVDVLTAIFYWGLDKELKNLPQEQSEVPSRQGGNFIKKFRKYLGYFFIVLCFVFVFLHYFIRASDGNYVYDIWGLRIPQPNPDGFFIPYVSTAIRLILETVSLHGLVGIVGTLTLFSLGSFLVDNKSENNK